MDEIDDEFHGPHDHPVIAALVGVALLVGAVLVVPRVLAPVPFSTLLGAGVVAGFVLWLIGFMITIRHSSATWKLGSLMILLGAGALAGVLANNQYQARERADPSGFAEIEFGPQGVPIMSKDAASRGPISWMFAVSVQADATERRALTEAQAKLGVGNLNSPYLLQQNPQSIAHCADFDGVKALARDQAGKRAARVEKIRAAIDAAEFDPAQKDAIRTIAAPADKDDAMLANQLAYLDATAELCTLLARRGWYNNNAYFGFNSGGDMARYKGVQAQRASLASEAEKIDRTGVARMKEGQEKLRALLS